MFQPDKNKIISGDCSIPTSFKVNWLSKASEKPFSYFVVNVLTVKSGLLLFSNQLLLVEAYVVL